MKEMFSNCSSLETIYFSNFNTINVTDMSGMFSFCSSIKKLNLQNFNTDNVNDMRGMFVGCSSLKELYLPNINNNIINIEGLFSGCSADFKNKIRQQYKFLNSKAFDYLYIYQ